MGSVGNQKSNDNPGKILLSGTDKGARKANVKKSLVGAKTTQTPASNIKGSMLNAKLCLKT